jgi:hypothetical protein
MGVSGSSWFRHVMPCGHGDVRASRVNVAGCGVLSSTVSDSPPPLRLSPLRFSIPGVMILDSGGLSKCGAGVFPLHAESPVKAVCMAAPSPVGPGFGVSWVSLPGMLLTRPRVVVPGGVFFCPPDG